MRKNTYTQAKHTPTRIHTWTLRYIICCRKCFWTGGRGGEVRAEIICPYSLYTSSSHYIFIVSSLSKMIIIIAVFTCLSKPNACYLSLCFNRMHCMVHVVKHKMIKCLYRQLIFQGSLPFPLLIHRRWVPTEPFFSVSAKGHQVVLLTIHISATYEPTWGINASFIREWYIYTPCPLKNFNSLLVIAGEST